MHSSKSHEYPLGSVKKENKGVTMEKALLVCKVALGRPYETAQNMDYLTEPPAGYNSVHGKVGTDLNYDEFVTYREDSVLPYAIVHYKYAYNG